MSRPTAGPSGLRRGGQIEYSLRGRAKSPHRPGRHPLCHNLVAPNLCEIVSDKASTSPGKKRAAKQAALARRLDKPCARGRRGSGKASGTVPDIEPACPRVTKHY